MIFFAGDIHLKRRVWAHLDLEDDTFRQFEQLVERASNEQAHLVLAGDVFDPPTSYSLKRYQEILSNFEGRVLVIEGQHELANPPWITVPGIKGELLDMKTVYLDGVTLAGLSYRPRTQLKAALEQIAELGPIDILVMHQLARSLGGPISWTLDESWIPPNVRSVVSGDWHIAEVLRLDASRCLYYVGSLFPQSRAEIGKDSTALKYSDAGFEYITLPLVRPLWRIVLRAGTEPNIPPLPAGCVLFVDYEPQCAEHVQRLEQSYPDIKIVRRALPSSVPIQKVEVRPETFDGLIGEFTQDEALKRLLEELLVSNEPTVTLQRFREEWYAAQAPKAG